MNILAIDFQKRKLSNVFETKKDLDNADKIHDKKISDLLDVMKKTLTSRQYTQALEAITSFNYHKKITNAKVIFYIDKYFLLA